MKKIFLFLAGFLLFVTLNAQNNGKYQKICIGFYNVENLFDTINQPDVNDEEFTPEGSNQWNTLRYDRKLLRLSEAISRIGDNGAAILGLAEVENRNVLEDLTRTPLLKNRNYGIVHYDSPEPRGIDVALLYDKNVFTLRHSKVHPLLLKDEPDFKTRDVLQASGTIAGETFHFLVAHFPSRREGVLQSEHRRIAAARLMRHITDSLLQRQPAAKIVLMGDFNDNPDNLSLSKVLQAESHFTPLSPLRLYNPMAQLHKAGKGSSVYRNEWQLFDNIIVNGNLTGDNPLSFRLYKDLQTGERSFVFNAPFLTRQSGRDPGYPTRTYAGKKYFGGYSDHFPVYIFIEKGKK